MKVHGDISGVSFTGKPQPVKNGAQLFTGATHTGDTVHFGSRQKNQGRFLSGISLSPNGLSINSWFRKSPEQKFIRAVQKNDRHGVDEYLKKGGNIDFQEKGGATALMHALGASHADMTKYLVEKGANKNLRDSNGQTALHSVVSSFNYFSPRTRKELAELIATPENINRQDHYTKRSALYSSIKNGFDDTSLALIALGANATLPDKDKLTTLMQAAWNDQAEVADALIKSVPELDERETFVTAKNKWGRTAEDMARTFKKANALKILLMHASRQYKDESTLAREAAEREAAEAAALQEQEEFPALKAVETDSPPAEEA